MIPMRFAWVPTAFLLACDARTSFSVADTEGWSYRAACTRAACASELQSPHEAHPSGACAPGTHAGFALVGRRVLVACQACLGREAPRIDAATCRALACTADTDCVPRRGVAPVRCLRGLCEVSGEDALDEPAAVGLCMAGAGPSGGDERPNHVTDRLALGRARCDATTGRCDAPPGCRAP